MKYATGKSLALASALLLLQGGAAVAQAAPAATDPGAPTQVVEFLFTLFKGEDAIHQAFLKEQNLEPELKEVVRQAIDGFDVHEMASRYAEPLSRIVSQQEYDQCLKFMKSEDAAAAVAVSNSVTSIQELPAALDAMPAARQRAFEAFFKLSCAEKTLTFMGSPDGKMISRNYGKHLVCAHIQHDRPEMIPVMKDLGECQDM